MNMLIIQMTANFKGNLWIVGYYRFTEMGEVSSSLIQLGH